MTAPLSGVKILDFTRLLPGPFGTMVLADLGAEVLRVEAPNFPDLLRAMPPMDGEVSVPHRQLNRGKRSLMLDLKNPRGQEVVRRLIKHYDVLVEQFRPGVMDRLGVGYQDLAKTAPGLIYCSITGYGQDGPYRDRAGHDINYLSLAGLMSFTGRKDSGPLPLGIQVADQCAGGLNAVVAILAALHHREKTGEGNYLDVSMTDGAFHLGAMYAASCLACKEEPGREGTLLNGGGYYDFYETSDGEYMAVGSLEPQFFKALCVVLGRPDLIGQQLAMGEKGAKLKNELKNEFKKKTRAEWEKAFAKVDACVEPVLSLTEALAHPLTRARGMVVEVPRPDGSRLEQAGSPYRFSNTPGEFRFTGVTPGANTREALLESGFSAPEIDELMSQKVIK